MITLGSPMNIVRRMPILIATMIVVGLLLGGVVAPMIGGAMEAYDRINPVLNVHATVVEVSADDVVVRLAGEKRRDCQYIGLQAYTRAVGSQLLTDAYIRRIDVPEVGQTRPVGEFGNLGTWRIWPRGEAGVVVVYAQHACSGRLVIGKIAEVMLKGG